MGIGTFVPASGKVAACRGMLFGGSILALALASTPALAQSAEETAENRFANEEIVVTARFKAETVQETPTAISAYGEAQLERIGARSIADLTASTPNVNIQSVTVVRTASAIVIRGMGAAGIESTEESPVGVSIDGVFITRPAASLLDTFDMDRVEVLRGPQGTSFGKNSLAGGIAAYTRNPGNDLSWDLEGTLGNYGRADLKGSINIPIVEDRLAVRFVAGLQTNDGWYRNRIDNSRMGEGDMRTLRATIDWNPTDNLSVNVKGFNVKDRAGAPGADVVPSTTSLLFALSGHVEPDDGPYTIGRDFPDEQTLDQWGVIGNVNLELGGVTLTSITGYIDTRDTQKLDLDQSEVAFFHQIREQEHDQFSQELRAAFDLDQLAGMINSTLVLGGYYLDQSFGQTGAFPWAIGGPANEDVTFQDNTAKALFAQGIFGLTDQLNLTLGIRHNWESKDYLRDPVGLPLGGAYTEVSQLFSLSEMRAEAERKAAAGMALVGSYNRQHTSLKAGLDYKFNNDVMAYFNYAEGYKGGGYGGRAASLSTMGPTEDNTSKLFEAGVKGDFFDRALRVNLAVFQTKFRNLQFPVFFANPNVATGQETAEQNIGVATTRGVEFETTYRTLDDWVFSLNGGYLFQRYDDFCADLDGPQSYATPPTSSCGGQVTLLPNGTYLVDDDYTDLKLTRAPKWQLQGSIDKTWELGGGDTIFARASAMYKSRYYQQVTNDPDGLSGNYVLVDASLGWESDDSRYRVTLWGKNLTDKTYVNGLIPVAGIFTQRFWSEPRTFGITLKVSN